MLDTEMSLPVFPQQLSCKHADARCNASRFLGSLSAHDKKTGYFAYGNENKVTVCRGKRVASNPAEQEPWCQVHAILETHSNEFIFGFLGFGLGLVAASTEENFPPFWFAAADLAVQFDAGTCRLLHGDNIALEAAIRQTKPCTCGQKNIELAATLDQSSETHYLEQVEQALAWVRQEESRRMTVARRVPLPPADLLNTFHCQASHNTLSRSFYLDIGSAAFVGKCPEVLLEWTPGKFDAYKLSGTYPKDTDPESDQVLLEQFLSDPKIIAEHQLSADGFGGGVAKVGEVSRSGPHVLDLYRLRHMMTTFSVTTAADTPLSDCLRAVLPPGVSPCLEGLPALLSIEKAKRGPYYGLVGFYSPDRKASFTQILRSVFHQQEDYYAWVGAAVTQGSTAKGELEESKLKLSDIVVALK